jgi:hypothetical protein
MDKLTFSTNWNHKLDCECFTTIRANDNYKVNSIYQVFHKRELKQVKIIDSRQFLLHTLNEWVCRLDTGYSKEETINIIKKMYSKYEYDWDTKKLSIYLCVTVK